MEDLNAQFAALVDGLDLDPTPQPIDVSGLTDLELGALYHKVRQELLDRGELMHPTTEHGRELHGLRGALLIERNVRSADAAGI